MLLFSLYFFIIYYLIKIPNVPYDTGYANKD